MQPLRLKTGGIAMKNELTAEEWLVLNEFLMYGGFVFEDWDRDGTSSAKSRLLDSATKKIKQTAKEIDSHML